MRAVEAVVVSLVNDGARVRRLLSDGSDSPLEDVVFPSRHGLVLERWCDPPQLSLQLGYQYRRRHGIHRLSLT
jgi:hypothetical protein